MKKSFVFLLHLGFWACYFILIIIMLGVYSRSSHGAIDQEAHILNALYSILLFAFMPSVISYFLYYYFLFPKYFQQKKIFLSVFIGILISAIASFIAYIILRYCIESGFIVDMDEGGKNGRSTIIIVLFVMTFIGVICGIVALVLKGFITWYNEIKLKENLREKNHEMEMALIKSQLDPHLLFNTINNIDALILKDAHKASDYLNKLSDIMRFILYETKTATIPLAKEIEYIDKYIALQKIRTSNENYVNFTVNGNIGGRTIAPMVFIPFIENAFKHTNNKKLENAITVKININDKSIQLVCENKFDSKSIVQQNDSGLGNDLIMKRLNLIYPDQHCIVVHKTNELYSINLTLFNG